MSNFNHHDPNEPRLRDTLRNDLGQSDFFHRIHIEFEEIRDFYVTEEKKVLLDSMPQYKKWFILLYWLLRSMLLKLTPSRRLMVIAATIFILSRGFVIQSGNVTVTTNWNILGLVLFVFVLMLELKDRILARSELAAGRTLQKALMPEQFPSFPGWTISLHSEPANEVGGDLVDFILLDKKNAAVVLADVSGKGLKAALMMAKLQAIIRVLMFDHVDNFLPTKKLNTIFKKESVTGMFASLLFLRLDDTSGIIRFVNAGHLPPLILRQSEAEELPKGNIALGIVENPDFDERTTELQTGETCIIFSDGVVEAQNILKEQFGLERLKNFLPTVASLPVSEIGRRLMLEVSIFVGEARPHDDLSFVIIKKE
jgi:phosphoserine phosphatase RsbU/P